MTSGHPAVSRPLWAGRALALVGVVLVAINLRTAVSALSPIFGAIEVDVPLGSLGIGLLGTLPPLCFAVFGLLTPLFQRRLRLESLVIVALVVMVLGDLGRAFSGSYLMLVVSSIVTFGAMGTGNVLLPPLVKKYFPDRIGLVTSLYATAMALFSLFPPLVAVPVTDAAGWRVAVGLWAVFALAAMVPWVTLFVRERRRSEHPEHPTAGRIDASAPQSDGEAGDGQAGDGQAGDGEASAGKARDGAAIGRVWHSGLAWSLAIMFGFTALNAYAFFAWLPELLTDRAGVDAAQAGSLLALYAAVGIPMSLIVPVLAVRLKNIGLLVWFGVVCYIAGDLGLLLVPSVATWLWVALCGLGPLLFPLSLVLVNLRTRTQAGSVALSGFMQGLGYLIGASGPLVVGILHQNSGSWTGPLIFLTATIPVVLVAGLFVARPRMLEDGWHRGTRRTLDR
ncbi:MFS transporter [Subtercola endophyticus]|uniref:MFS transporter n=1 Tax=Subtercola endophyticus TaxID=2895559 RepID=UPI001E3E530D|nr:MFS transporter [Subtercola endophyticus]UFS60094.1 MFS transporter [Subtercola endophyticus]